MKILTRQVKWVPCLSLKLPSYSVIGLKLCERKQYRIVGAITQVECSGNLAIVEATVYIAFRDPFVSRFLYGSTVGIIVFSFDTGLKTTFFCSRVPWTCPIFMKLSRYLTLINLQLFKRVHNPSRPGYRASFNIFLIPLNSSPETVVWQYYVHTYCISLSLKWTPIPASGDHWHFVTKFKSLYLVDSSFWRVELGKCLVPLLGIVGMNRAMGPKHEEDTN